MSFVIKNNLGWFNSWLSNSWSSFLHHQRPRWKPLWLLIILFYCSHDTEDFLCAPVFSVIRYYDSDTYFCLAEVFLSNFPTGKSSRLFINHIEYVLYIKVAPLPLSCLQSQNPQHCFWPWLSVCCHGKRLRGRSIMAERIRGKAVQLPEAGSRKSKRNWAGMTYSSLSHARQPGQLPVSITSQ